MKHLFPIKFISLSILLIVASSLSSQVTPLGANSDSDCGADCWDWFEWSPAMDAAGGIIPNYGDGEAVDANCNTSITADISYTGSDPDGIDLSGQNIGANMQGGTAWTDEWILSFSEPLTNPVLNIIDLFGDSEVCISDCDGVPISITDMSSGTIIPGGCFLGNDQIQLSGTYDCFFLTVMNNVNDRYSFSVGTCLSANLPPPCTMCSPNFEYDYLTLDNASGAGTGATADVNVGGALYGTATVLYSDVSINEDLDGSAFGAIANGSANTETLILAVELCAPITVQQVDIIGLETESQVWVGSALSGAGDMAIPTGFTLTQCGGGGNMMSTGNMVTNTSTNCNNQGNGNYSIGGATVSTLYFRYTNPAGGCSIDKATFRIGLCLPSGNEAIPTCPLSYITYTNDMDDYILNGPTASNTFSVMQDANGNFFDADCSGIAGDVMDVDGNGDGDLLDVVDIDANANGTLDAGNAIPTISISPCAEVIDLTDCNFCTTPPPCEDCIEGDFQLINLQETGITAAGLPVGIIEINGVCIGNFEYETGNMGVRLDANGSTFGGADTDGGFMCIRVDFCDPQVVQQIDILGLEVGSMVQVGTTKSGTGAATNLGGLTLTHCDGSTRMDADDITNGNKVTTAGPGCLANPDASYSVGMPTVSTLFLTYMNPAGNCTRDYVGFNIGICYNTQAVYALPICPIEIYEVSCSDPLGNLANTQTVAIDAVGNIFQDYDNLGNANTNTTCGDGFPIDDSFMGQITLQEAVDTATPLLTANLGCAEVTNFTDTECIIDGCTQEPECSMCPLEDTYDYLVLDQNGTSTGGLPLGIVELNNVKIGTYEFLYSDLDNNTDGNGSTFGGSDVDGGTFILELDLCEPITIAELEVLGLEVQSMVTIGTNISGSGPSAVVGGMTLTHCEGSDRMDGDDITGGNTITTAGPGCLANPDASYITSPATTSTIYFKYHNPPGGCTRDYVGFRIGACVEPFEEMIIPECSIALYEVDECPDDPTSPTFTYLQDGNGNWFNMTCPTSLPTSPIQAIPLSPCASVTYIEDCPICVIPGLAKTITNVSRASSGIAGNVDVTFKFSLTNFGGADMTNLVISDDLNSIPGYIGLVGVPNVMLSANPSGTAVAPMVNSSYNGMGNLLNGTSGSLNEADEIMVFITVELNASLVPDNHTNTAQGGGTPPNGGTLFLDDSQNGLIADPDGDANPANNSQATPLFIPAINTAKEFINVVSASSGTLGNYDATVQIVVENTGNVPLTNITLSDDLATELTGAFVAVITDPMISATTATINPTVNGAYNGNSNVNIFNGTSGNLEAGESITVTFVIEVNPNNSTSFLTDNQAIAGGKGLDVNGNPLMYPDGSMILVSDASDSGLDPDSSNNNGLGNTGGSDDPTPLQIPELSISKDCIGIEQTECLPAGNVDVTYQLYVMNTGNVDLSNVLIQDDLEAEFGPSFVEINSISITTSPGPSTPTLNSGFNGSTDIDIFNGTSGTLSPNDIVVITINAEFNPNAEGAPMFGFNQANGTAIGPNYLGENVTVSDLSDSGTDPNSINQNQPNNSDELGTNETAEDPTPFPMPNLNSAMEMVAIGPSTTATSGQFTITYNLYIENTGNVDLSNICALDQLDAPIHFGVAFVSVVSPPTIISSTAAIDPITNGLFNGRASNNNLLTGTSGLLEPGDALTIEFTVEVNPFDAQNGLGLCNQVTTKASGLGCEDLDIVVTDLSDDGDTPESENTDSFLSANHCSSDCTIFGQCYESVCSQLSCNDHINISASEGCEVYITADMIMEGIDPECLGAGFPSFYDVVIEDSEGNRLPVDDTYGGVVLDASDFIGQTIVVYVESTCNGYGCSTTVLIEDKIAPTLACECETPYLEDGVTPNPDCSFKCYEVWDLEELESLVRSGNEVLPSVFDNLPEDNCLDFGAPAIAYSYGEGANCGEQIVTRELAWTYVDETGQTQYLTCTQNYLFDNLELSSVGATVDGAWDGYSNIFEAVTGDRPVSDMYTPEQIVNLPCGADYDPVSIATFYDIDTPGRPSPASNNDYDDETPNLVEYNEGIPYAFPYVVQAGWTGRYHAKPIDNNICNIWQVYSDLTYDTCADDCFGNSKIARTWTILDWCDASTVEFVQTIKRVDEEGPQVSGPDYTISVDPWGCTANFEVPAPEHLQDNCDKNPTWTVVGPVGVEIVNGYAIDLPKGTTTLTYVAEDCCGNQTYSSFNVTVADRTAPTAIALQNIVVQLTNEQDGDGIAKLFALDVDNESHDGCTDVNFEIRRPDDIDWCHSGNSTFNNDGHIGDDSNDTDNGEYVIFCCEDLLDIDENGVAYGLHDVLLRVWDDGDMDGVFGSAGDNYNEVWTTVRVEDKQAPVVVCPPHIELSCDQDFNDYDLTGRPYGFRTCGDIVCDNEPSDSYRSKPSSSAPFVGESIPAYNPSCRRGAIQRKWTCDGEPCTQWIIMRDTEEGDLEITWPDDVTADCIDIEYDEPQVLDRLCELTGTNLESDTFYFEDGACYKILNYWTVINWCDYDANDTDLNDELDAEDDGEIPGLYSHTQILKLIDTEKPTITTQDTCFAVNADCVGEGIQIWAGGSDNGICASPWLKWEAEVDMNSDWNIDYTFSSYFAPNDPFYIAPTAGDVHINLPDGLSNGCASSHRVRWTVSDGCGNETQATSFFTIEDKKKPTPYMLNLSTALMQDGSVELWASDFDTGSFDNCAPQDFLLFTFSETVPPQLLDPSEDRPWYDSDGVASENDYLSGNAELWDGSAGTSAMIFNEEDLASSTDGLLEIPVYVWDLCGNSDFAIVNLKLIDNDGDATANISGRVSTEDGVGVVGVSMTATTGDSNYTTTTTTLENGEYMFEYNPINNDYTLTGEKNDDWLNGVTTLDIVMIQRHILSIDVLDSPYKMIAADASNDQRISAIDMIQLRKLILGIYSELPNNDSWRFTDADAQMDSSNPWPFSEFVNVTNLDADMVEDFVGTKVGDVNGSIELLLQGQSTDTRSGSSLKFNIEQSDLGQGVTELRFKSSNFVDISGFQFTLDGSVLEIVETTSGLMEITTDNIGLVDGSLAMSWNASKMMSYGEGTLFTVKVKKSDAGLSMSDRVARSEAYQGAGLETINVSLEDTGLAINSLGQNEPNPWVDETLIRYSISHGGPLTLTIVDLNGKTIYTFSEEASAGSHEHVVDRKDLGGATGILFYQIETKEYSQTNKMLLVE